VLLGGVLLLVAIPAAILLFRLVFAESPGEIEGIVTLDGKPLASGYVTIWPSRKMSRRDLSPRPRNPGELFSALIEAVRSSRGGNSDELLGSLSTSVQPDGSFSLWGIPPGPALVCVRSQFGFRGSLRLPPGERWIPARYSDPEKSGLSINVKSGRQTFDLELKSPDWVKSD
jgi:hypothetical protein